MSSFDPIGREEFSVDLSTLGNPDELALLVLGLSGGGLNGCMTASGSPEPYGCNPPPKVYPGQDTTATLVKPQSPYGWQSIGVIGVAFAKVLIDTPLRDNGDADNRFLHR